MARFDFIFWDGDGTLVDTESLGKEAFMEVGKRFDLNLTSDEFDETTGWSAKKRYTKMVEEDRFGRTPPSEAKWMQMLKVYQAENQHKITVLPGIPGLLRLAAANGLRSSLVTNSRKSSSATKIAALREFERHLEFRLTAPDPAPEGSPFGSAFGIIQNPKPHPEGYVKALNRVGANRTQAVVFEDSKAGVEAAHAAGLKCVQIQSDPAEFSDKASLRVDSLGNKRDFDKVVAFMGLKYDPAKQAHRDNRIHKIDQSKPQPVRRLGL
ncbi:MAG: HAD family phosphatase [Pseudomonadota bacterium]